MCAANTIVIEKNMLILPFHTEQFEKKKTFVINCKIQSVQHFPVPAILYLCTSVEKIIKSNIDTDTNDRLVG